MNTLSVTRFKARCLASIERVARTGESITLTKHGRVIVKVAAVDASGPPPWHKLRARPGRWRGNPLAPVVDLSDIDALK